MPTPIGGEMAWWCPSLDETGNGTATLHDLVGSANGTLTNMDPSDWVNDTANGGVRALDFDGVNDYVSCGNTILSGTGDFTLSLWVKLHVLNDDQVFAGNYGSGAGNLTGIQIGTTKAYATPVLAANRFNFYLGTHLQGSTTFVANTWYHLAAVRSGGVVTLFVNGVVDGSGTRSNSVASTVPWVLGRGSNYSGEEFTGRIDDLRIFNRALNQTEITALASYRGYQLPSNTRRRRYTGGFGL